MFKNILIATTALSLTLAPSAFAQDVDGAKFRAVQEGEWYHPIEPDTWAYIGADEVEVFRVLTRIEAARGDRADPEQPDTIRAYGPGNGIYEFVQAGDAAVERAENATGAERLAALKAIAYYHTASAPHTRDSNAVAALNKAFGAYEEAAEELPGSFRDVELTLDGTEFEAFLHLPEGNGPHPVLVFSYGSDTSRVTALNYYEAHLLPKGISLLAIDVPGMGGSAGFDVTDGNTEKLHVAAVDWAKAQPQIDVDNIFVQGVSFGGNAAARVWTEHKDLDLAGVVYTWGR